MKNDQQIREYLKEIPKYQKRIQDILQELTKPQTHILPTNFQARIEQCKQTIRFDQQWAHQYQDIIAFLIEGEINTSIMGLCLKLRNQIGQAPTSYWMKMICELAHNQKYFDGLKIWRVLPENRQILPIKSQVDVKNRKFQKCAKTDLACTKNLLNSLYQLQKVYQNRKSENPYSKADTTQQVNKDSSTNQIQGHCQILLQRIKQNMAKFLESSRKLEQTLSIDAALFQARKRHIKNNHKDLPKNDHTKPIDSADLASRSLSRSQSKRRNQKNGSKKHLLQSKQKMITDYSKNIIGEIKHPLFKKIKSTPENYKTKQLQGDQRIYFEECFGIIQEQKKQVLGNGEQDGGTLINQVDTDNSEMKQYQRQFEIAEKPSENCNPFFQYRQDMLVLKKQFSMLRKQVRDQRKQKSDSKLAYQKKYNFTTINDPVYHFSYFNFPIEQKKCKEFKTFANPFQKLQFINYEIWSEDEYQELRDLVSDTQDGQDISQETQDEKQGEFDDMIEPQENTHSSHLINPQNLFDGRPWILKPNPLQSLNTERASLCLAKQKSFKVQILQDLKYKDFLKQMNESQAQLVDKFSMITLQKLPIVGAQYTLKMRQKQFLTQLVSGRNNTQVWRKFGQLYWEAEQLQLKQQDVKEFMKKKTKKKKEKIPNKQGKYFFIYQVEQPQGRSTKYRSTQSKTEYKTSIDLQKGKCSSPNEHDLQGGSSQKNSSSNFISEEALPQKMYIQQSSQRIEVTQQKFSKSRKYKTADNLLFKVLQETKFQADDELETGQIKSQLCAKPFKRNPRKTKKLKPRAQEVISKSYSYSNNTSKQSQASQKNDTQNLSSCSMSLRPRNKKVNYLEFKRRKKGSLMNQLEI